MSKSAMIGARIKPELKEEANEITLETAQKTDAGKELNEYANLDAFKRKIGAN